MAIEMLVQRLNRLVLKEAKSFSVPAKETFKTKPFSALIFIFNFHFINLTDFPLNREF